MREIKFKAWDKQFKQWSKIATTHPIEDINLLTDYEWYQYTELSTQEWGNCCLVIKDYDSEGVKTSHNEINMLDILDHKLWEGRDIKIDVMDYLCSVELEENIEFFNDMDDRYGHYEMEG